MKKFRYVFIILLVFFMVDLTYPGSNFLSVSAAENVDFQISAKIPYSIVEVGTSVNITANANANGKKVNDFTFKTGNKKIATVSTKGKITAVSPGECKIKVGSKKYSKYDSYYINIKVVERVIKITGPKKYEAGKTYSLKASEKNVTWKLFNTYEDSADASIDPLTGKIKVRNAGSFYVVCTSNDKKGLGGVYINAVGPVIEEQMITLDPIIITEDLHLASVTEIYAIDQLPKTVTVSYNNQGKIGEVEVEILWGGAAYYYWNRMQNERYYIIHGWFDIPKGYRYLGNFYELKANVEIKVLLKTAQTDNRKEIISIAEMEPITISEDMHITTTWQLWDTLLYNTMLIGTCEDGSTVELPIRLIDCSNNDFTIAGTYECELRPRDIQGYVIKKDLYTKLIVNIEKEQTWLSKWDGEFNLDTIAPVSWENEFTSQFLLGKKYIH